MKKKLLMISGLILALVLSMCLLGGCGDETGPTSEPAGEQQEEKEAEPKTEFSQDEVVNYNDVKFTVTSVEKHMGGEFDTPKDGSEYVTVGIKIENNSDEKISYNPYDWKMENSNGQETDTAIVLNDSELESGDLNPGGHVEGTLTFEEPQGDEGLKLNYYDNMLFDEEAAFKIIIK